VTQAQEEDDAEDDGGDENLSDVVIEDLLIRVGSVMKVWGLRLRYLVADDGIHCGEFVLFYVHALDSLGWEHRGFPALGQRLFMGEFPCFQGQGVYNKGSSLPTTTFCKNLRINSNEG